MLSLAQIPMIADLVSIAFFVHCFIPTVQFGLGVDLLREHLTFSGEWLRECIFVQTLEA